MFISQLGELHLFIIFIKKFQKGDAAHIEAMNEMQKMMKEPTDFAKWFESKKVTLVYDSFCLNPFKN